MDRTSSSRPVGVALGEAETDGDGEGVPLGAGVRLGVGSTLGRALGVAEGTVREGRGGALRDADRPGAEVAADEPAGTDGDAVTGRRVGVTVSRGVERDARSGATSRSGAGAPVGIAAAAAVGVPPRDPSTTPVANAPLAASAATPATAPSGARRRLGRGARCLPIRSVSRTPRTVAKLTRPS